ncbi:MAG TPA: hypothetical protein EYP56_00780 [Planctomycetaceae bacterium]|nr:hypothetical protein [Planctomycetaceae bacterium]HIQ22746.1 hypothetical protein [Planctomycetota bacterium]
MRFFLAGIMQGSLAEPRIHDQDYRRRIKQLLAGHFPDAQIYDPLANHAQSIRYDDQLGRQVFFRHNAMCRDVDVLLAFLPEASMGTAIEMWEAYRHGAAVITISPLAHNWTVKFLSHAVYPDIDHFAADLESGRLKERISQVLSGSTRSP